MLPAAAKSLLYTRDFLPAAETFPWPTSTTSFWRTQLHPLDSYRSTSQLPDITDIAIIGAGMSGVSTAFHIIEESKKHANQPSITTLEARQLCSGATGRNGGHLKLAVPHITKVLEEYGKDAAVEIAEFHIKQMHAMKEVVDKEVLDCDFLLTRSFDVFMDDGQATREENEIKRLCDAGIDVIKQHVSVIRKEYIEAVTGVKGAAGARSVPAASLWPYKFVTSLMAKIIDKVNLQTHTMVHAVSEMRDSQGYYTIHTARGDMRARKVVFASNAYTAGILPSLETIITPTRGTNSRVKREHASIIDSLQTRTYTYNIYKDPKHVDYIVHRLDGSAIIGGAKETFDRDLETWVATVDDSTLIKDPLPRLYFEGRLERYYQDWATSGASVDLLWTGIMGSTPDGFSLVGDVPARPGQHIIAGFNGAGMVFIFLSSRGLANMIVDDVPFEQTGVPRILKMTNERLNEMRKIISENRSHKEAR